MRKEKHFVNSLGDILTHLKHRNDQFLDIIHLNDGYSALAIDTTNMVFYDYCEGDLTILICDNEQEFNSELEKFIEFCKVDYPNKLPRLEGLRL